MADAWGGSWGVAWGISWGSGATPTPPTTDTHDGGHYEDYDALRRRIREAERAQECSERAKRTAERKLAHELEAAYRRIVLNEPEIAREIAAAIVEPMVIADVLPDINWRGIGNILDKAAMVLDRIERAKAAEWAARDEEDVMILLLAQ